ncbi:ATP-binding cassette sub-family G member 1-like [Haematobia irritans]|uniref:ATP-binding cassette sub-family G member 1-like n=1 Tax=Haematobia irritans TaxID=7368 RepID=UPI003F50CEE3
MANGYSNGSTEMNVKKNDFGYNIFQRITNDSLVNLHFCDVTYSVLDRNGKSTKNILNGVSGEFRAGQLSAIMGPSGSGKTSLLNLLSGYRIRKTSGTVSVNGRLQDFNTFNEYTRYILQDDHISPHFTVGETMMYASKFKLNPSYTIEQRQSVIDEILDIFQLLQHSNTKVGLLSGGQRKRVCIALEIMDKPPVLFLDEPTTGLDEYSAAQCVTLLKRLANSGHTVICSIHCPSAKLFQMFDKVFILAAGECIYQGDVDYVVPYLKQFNLECPITYNPADFIIEAATKAYGNIHEEMVRHTNNGKLLKWIPPSKDVIKEKITNDNKANTEGDTKVKVYQINSCSWWYEYRCIFIRITQQIWRDKSNMQLRVTLQLFVAIMTACAYAGFGNNAKFAMSNYYFILLTCLQFVFMCTLPMFAHVPLEMQYLRREYFNRWYRLSSYFLALLTSQIPITTVMCLCCSAILYFVTGQPVETFRFFLFFGMNFLTSMVGITFGLFIGSRFCLLNALFIGPNITSIWVVFSNLGLEKLEPTLFETILMKTSYIKHSMEGILATLFKFDRGDFKCPTDELFCYFHKPKYFLRHLGSSDVNYLRSVIFLIMFYFIFMTLAFVNFKSRLEISESTIKNRYYLYIKHKLKTKLAFKFT